MKIFDTEEARKHIETPRMLNFGNDKSAIKPEITFDQDVLNQYFKFLLTRETQ